MRKLILILIALCSYVMSFAQEFDLREINLQSNDSLKQWDEKYREDQFYFALSHNLMQDKPKGYSPSSISLGIDFGFLRDIPLNKSRTIAIAPGIGYSYENLRHNFGATADKEYQILENYSSNRLSMHFLDFPIELRWRNSTPESHKFWRTYVGFKASYLLSSNQKTVTSDYSVRFNSDDDLNKWMFGMYAGAGFNTWNLYVYYGLNTLYKEAPIANDPVKLRLFKVGLIFYIL